MSERLCLCETPSECPVDSRDKCSEVGCSWVTRDGETIKLLDGAAYIWTAVSSRALHWHDERASACHDENGNSCVACLRCPACCDCETCENCNAKTESICSRCDGCTNCCDCATCDNCNRRVDEDNLCSNCNGCTDRCCSCSTCESCSEIYSDVCGCCCRCESCCNCHEGALPRVAVYDLTWHGRAKDKVGPQRYVSTEIEISFTSEDRVSSIVNKWGSAIVDDGSLGSNGSEINTAPARGAAWREQISELCDGLRRSGALVDRSCGLHVHIDARDFSYYDVRRLIRLYARIEPALFTLVSESRRSGNTYCIPCASRYLKPLSPDHHMKATKQGVLMGVYNVTPDRYENSKRWKEDKYNGARYAALNLHSWVYRGTIECRLHQGSTDAKKIVAWGELWSHIIEYAYTHTDKQVDALPNLPSYTYNLSHKAESYDILRNHVCAGLPELQTYLDERARHFAVITLGEGK